MSQGFLLFVHDNEQIQYSLLAVWQARRIRQWLNKPVSIVTDQQSLSNLKNQNLDQEFDHIIISDAISRQQKKYGDQQLSFHNVDRCMAWNLTPYDETILIDTDIAIQSDRLNTLWNHQEDLLVCKYSSDLLGRTFTGFDFLSNYGVEFYWATVCYFKKNDNTQTFFNNCLRIKEKYSWYAHVYDITTSYIRNDHIWSISLHELGGSANSTWVSKIPFNLYYTLDTDQIASMSGDAVTVFNKENIAKIKGSDLHIMNKFDLLDRVRDELI